MPPAVIARQTGTSIVITDPGDLEPAASRRSRANYSARARCKKLAKAAGAKAIQVGETGWRLVAAPM